MTYLENEIKEISETWFPHHVAHIQGEEGLRVIDFGTPGTNNYRVKYVLSGNNIFISGDIGEAVYTLTCAATLQNIKDFNFSYLMKKLSAYSKSRWDFNAKQAKEQLKAYWASENMNDYKDEKEMYQGILEAIEESYSLAQYQAHLAPVYHNTSLGADDLEVIEEFGKEMPLRLVAYWVGLQMAIIQLEKQKEKTI